MDYMETAPTYRLNRNPEITCFPVETIGNNDFDPETRYFTVNLDTSTAGTLTIIQPSSLRINIIDDDGKLCSLDGLDH